MRLARPRIDDDTYFRLRGWIPMPLYAASLLLMAHHPLRSWEIVLGPWLVVLGLGLRGAARIEMGRSSDTRRLHAKHLVTDGIYAWICNPIYVGNWLIAMGVFVVGGIGAWSLALGALLFLHYSRVVRAEERMLERTFGEVYEAYRDAVPRFAPVRVPARAETAMREMRREGRIVGWVCAGITVIVALRVAGG
jgi:protein-S-isoprenylcysteine O-methyltransferase Ste14